MFQRGMVFLCVWVGLVTCSVAESLDAIVALVNDKVITASQLQEQVTTLSRQMAQKQVAMPNAAMLRKQVLQHMIDVNLQLQMAHQNDVHVDSVDLDEAIEKIASSNHMTITQLRQAIENSGISWKEYRNNIQQEMVISRLQQQALSKDLVISDDQVEEYLKTYKPDNSARNQYHLLNILIPLPEAPSTAQLEKANQKAHELLNQIHKGADFASLAMQSPQGEWTLEGGDLGERYLAQLPEVFGKQVVHMQMNEVAGPLRTANGFQLIKLVGIKGDAELAPITQTHVRQILIKADAAGAADSDAKVRAMHIYEQLRSGRSFDLLAKQYSLDPRSVSAGGDLGWVAAGDLPPTVERVMTSLSIHQISQPIQSPVGWHIIEVLARKTVYDSKAVQRQAVRQLLLQRQFASAVQTWQQQLRANAYIRIMDRALS